MRLNPLTGEDNLTGEKVQEALIDTDKSLGMGTPAERKPVVKKAKKASKDDDGASETVGKGGARAQKRRKK